VGGRSGSAILKRAAGKCSLLLGAVSAIDDQLEVEVVSLERFLSLAGFADSERIDLIKVDIEGAELAMFEDVPDASLLRGAQFTVEFYDFILPALSPRVNGVKLRLQLLGFPVIKFSLANTEVLFVN
jgi:hypothetical protein